MVTIPSEGFSTASRNLASLQCAHEPPQVDVPSGVTIDPMSVASLTVHQLDKLRTARWSAPELIRSIDGHSQNIPSRHTTACCPTSSMGPLSAGMWYAVQHSWRYWKRYQCWRYWKHALKVVCQFARLDQASPESVLLTTIQAQY